MAAIAMAFDGSEEYELPPRKKPKISELPLSSAQRSSIDGMLHTFKKKGEFDSLRKKTFQQYNESAARGIFENALRTFTTDEIEREPLKYLKPSGRLAAPLIEGAAARAQIYDKVESSIDSYIELYLESAERALREIRRKEVGEEQAISEQERGLKSDEAYAGEADKRRDARAKQFAEEEKLRKKKEAQERKRKEIDALKKKQEQLMRETERLQRDQKRRLEREEWKKAEKERERERIRKYNEDREKQQKEAEEREKALQAEREKVEKEAQEREQKRLEEEALSKLLREGREREDRGRRPEMDHRRDVSIEPPNRPRFAGTAPRNAYARDEMRLHGLMPTSLTIRKDDKVEPPRREPEERRRSRSPLRERRDDDRPRRTSRERYREGTMRKESYYRDLSAEREAWKKRAQNEDGEVVEPATRARSRSQGSYRRRTRSPPRRTRERSREYSPPRRRERSRSPNNIDRYVPGKAVPRRREDSRDRSRDRRRDRSRSRRDYSRDRRDRSRGIGRERSRDRREEDRRRDDRPRPVEIDRYVPGDSSRRRERSRSRDRRRDRSKDTIRTELDKKLRK